MSDFLDLHDDHVSRRLLFVIAFVIIAVPIAQSIFQIWPLRLSNIQWRFGAANALSGVLPLPFLGFSLLLLMARGMESRGLARLVGALSTLFTLGLLASIALFVLDAQELKAIVSSQMAGQFRSVTLRVGLVSITFLIAFGLLSIFGFAGMPGGRTSRKSTRATTAQAEPSDDAPEIIMRR